MEAADREALIHMLRAQRAQIDASLALLTKDEPPAQEPATRQPPRVLGGRTREQP